MLRLPAVLLAFFGVTATTFARGTEFSFVHPGLLHTRDDLARMRTAIAAKQEPIFSGYEKFRTHSASPANTAMRGPAEEIGRNPTVKQVEFDADANAAYQCALMWSLTGDRAFAAKAKEIVDAWSATLKRVGGADAVLMAGLGPFKFVNAAELLRHTDAGWPAANAARTQRMLRGAIYPAIADFAPFANGNWDTAAIKTMLAIAVFCDDRVMFERALRYYVAGHGNGRLTHYVINEAGQCQESGRDMGHTQLGLGHLGDACEIAWSQGLDLFSYADNRLLHGFEYAARYNLGESVPFEATLDRTGKYPHRVISAIGRGRLRPIYEQIFHHYAHRAGGPAAGPWTQRAAEKLRPEGEALPGADHTGFGTLLYTRPRSAPEATPPAPPAAVIAQGEIDGITLTWIPPRGAERFSVLRRESDDSPWGTRARDLAETRFVDHDVRPHRLYHYALLAHNAAGESAASVPVRASAGLPVPWTQQARGGSGTASFDGGTFTLEAAGTGEHGLFVHTPLASDVAIVARLVPQVSSQFSSFGLVCSDAAPDSARATLLIAPRRESNTERPTWQAVLQAGPNSAAAPAAMRLESPVVEYGRLVGACWLRLARRGNRFTASLSEDGEAWKTVGTTVVPLERECVIGLFANSGVESLTTTVRFDHVRLHRVD